MNQRDLALQKEVKNLFYGTGFKLTDDEKKRLLKISPEFKDHFTAIEKICEAYLTWYVLSFEHPTKADFLQRMNGDKNNIGYIGRLKKSLEANVNLMEIMAGPDGLLQPNVSLPLFEAIENTIEQIKLAIKEAETEIKKYVTKRKAQSSPNYLLVGELAALYFKIIGSEPTRINPIYCSSSCPSEKSPIADIIKILDPRLKCGPCTGYIKNTILARKEDDITALEEKAVPDLGEGYSLERRRKVFNAQIDKDIIAQKGKFGLPFSS